MNERWQYEDWQHNADPTILVTRGMTWFMAHCNHCGFDLPFSSETNRDAWVRVHQRSNHGFGGHRGPTVITLREEVR